MKPTNLAFRLTAFLGQHLPGQRNLSPNTIWSYRDTFTQLLRYCRERRDIPPEKLDLDDLTPDLLLDFLEYIESVRGCSSSTRNVRLTALQSFFRYLQTEDPERLVQCQRILAIPRRRCPRPMIGYLTKIDLGAILEQPDLSCPEGRRDAVLLSLLYDTAARVQEIISLRVRDVRLEAPAQVRLFGKGRKTRAVPILKATVELLSDYIEAYHLLLPERLGEPLFQNRRGQALSRSGVRYIIEKYTGRAQKERQGFTGVKVTPHTFRHTKAMHLLQADIPVVVIRDILGHADIATTSIYARADLDAQRRALEKVSTDTPPPRRPSWQSNPDLLGWLRGL